MPTFVLGMNAKLYAGDPDVALGALTELTNVKDVTLNLEAGESDITTRGNSGWRSTAATLREASVEFEMVWRPGDFGFNLVKGAFLGTGPITDKTRLIEMAVLDGPKSGWPSTVEGLRATFSITSFVRSEPLEEAMTVSVTAKLETFKEWEVI